ncbi:methyl-accepting chemotaxis protein [Metabacillus endolithicus]|uniref:Methyl-accepting chemotaxis protein n=1 Tax=Metabacillus endolithicus TaxID=1535204 RepID=A0ABW5BYW0_9BACI|nr:methyl-accepting chemotaxis protein [Metabacillus endolithicus]UPG65299.1 methyl-accepting chemotaxis protein [Metabacillus endolithicus]
MKITIQKKLLSGFLLLAILIGMVSALSYYQIHKINNSYSELVEQQTTNLTSIKDIQLYASRSIASLRGMQSAGTDNMEFFQTSLDQITEQVKNIEADIQDQESKELLTTITSLKEQIIEQVQEEQATKLVEEESIPLAIQIEEAANRIVEIQTKEMKTETKANTEMVSSVKNMMLVWSLISLILAILIGMFMSRMITRPISLLVEGAKRIASGDLTQEDISVKNSDEISELANSFNIMKQNLQQLIDEVRLNAHQVSVTSEELSASADATNLATQHITLGMQEVAAGAEKQVSTVIQSVESAEEITKGMNKVTESIQSVANLTIVANEKATLGNDVVNKTINQMKLVQDSAMESAEVVHTLSNKSKEIGHIIELITKVASQTDLLALNAAIEAARAGEQGKGFAVVADEVRKLAVQSADAAGQIRQLIEEIQEESEKAVRSMNNGTDVVKEGLKLVSQTGDSFKNILGAIQQVAAESHDVAAIVNQIHSNTQIVTEGMKEARDIVEQSSVSIQNVAASTEEQNATMEEVSSSAEGLSEMAQNLNKVINKFKA